MTEEEIKCIDCSYVGALQPGGTSIQYNWKMAIENNHKAKSAPFEVYINDPAMVKDASEIQTDIYQSLE